jgi:hypothetical protein
MPWKFYLGACLLTASLLVPHAGIRPVLAGEVLAGVVLWLWTHRGPGASL